MFILMKGSTARHGISLRTLIRKSADISGPCLLVCSPKVLQIFTVHAFPTSIAILKGSLLYFEDEFSS